MGKNREIGNISPGDRSRWNTAIFLLLCATPVFSTLGYGGVDIWAQSFLALAAALVVIFWAADAWRKKEFRFDSGSLQLPIMGLIIIGVVQLLPLSDRGISPELLGTPAAAALSMDPYATRFFVIRLIILFVFFAAALAYIDSRERVKKTVLMTVIFGAVMAFFAILQRLASPEAIYGLRPTPQAISFGPFVNQHHFAAFMEMTAGLTLSLLLGNAIKKDRKLLLGIAAALMGIAVVFSGSRGGLISLVSVIGAVVLAHYFLKKRDAREPQDSGRKLLVFAAAAVAAIVIVGGSAIFLGEGDFLLRATGLQADQSDITSGRLHFWSVAVQIFLAHPVLGAGYDAFGAAFSRYDTWTGMYRVEQAHNDYLQILADAGIAGFACIAAFIFLFFRKSLNIIGSSADRFGRDAAIGALAGCTGILVHSFFDFPLRTTSNAFFFLLLVVIAISGFDLRRKFVGSEPPAIRMA
ncbi:MAG: O-antigen ligase family protein [Saprospiraceae bacterium]|nr:O-antigen ligase family protein [Pyrinomonadaceae bacterium]